MDSTSATQVLSFWFGRELKAWFEKNPAGCLALVLLLDQLPRSMFRGSAKAFAADPLARAAARLIVDNGWDKASTPEEMEFLKQPGSSF